MTKTEIHTILEIPTSTLNDWEKPSHGKNKLYNFLLNSSKEEVLKKTLKQSHRIFHILNRNIENNYRFTHKDIQIAFSKSNYFEATENERLIYSKFFKECDTDDLDSFIKTFSISIRNIKKIYTDLPERKLAGVAKVWNRRFRLKRLPVYSYENDQIPSVLANILKKRALD